MTEAAIVDFPLTEVAAACGVMVTLTCTLVTLVLIARSCLK